MSKNQVSYFLFAYEEMISDIHVRNLLVKVSYQGKRNSKLNSSVYLGN